MKPLMYDPFVPNGGLLEGGWSKSPELIDRMTMLPIGQYEDGSLTLAWPSMLKDMYEGAVRSYAAQEGPPIYDDGGQYVSGANMQPLDAFNAASIAPMAGVAGRMTGAVPRGALGSGGSDMLTRAAPELPMDQASRLARAREMGFDTDQTWYHGTRQDFDAFDPGRTTLYGEPDVAVAMSSSPHLASAYAGAKLDGGGWWPKLADAPPGAVTSPDGAKVVPAHLRMTNPLRVEANDWLSRGENARYLAEAERGGHDGVVFHYTSPGYGPDGLYEALVPNPRNIRSVNAAFDPSQSDSSFLLAANQRNASLPAIATQGDEDQYSTQDILRQYGLRQYGLLGP